MKAHSAHQLEVRVPEMGILSQASWTANFKLLLENMRLSNSNCFDPREKEMTCG